ncbi:MAG: FAD binding domain-containing protein [Acidimicrobiales bacterium]|nr:FAD binding domain-containing protein [Acidimicrobiales bacterium]
MKAAPFDYHRPETIDDAADMLGALPDARVLAGGQSLVPMLNLRLAYFDNLIDIRGIRELSMASTLSDTVRIGASVTQAEVELNSDLARSVPLVARALPFVGHFPLRNRGTVCGSIAHADPAAELPAVLVALGGTVEVTSTSGRREIPAGEFFLGTWWTALKEGELVEAVRFPIAGDRSGCAVREVARRHGDFAIAGSAVHVEVDDAGCVAHSGIAMFGVASTPVHAREVEELIRGARLGDLDIEAVGAAAVAGLDDIPDDSNASSLERRTLAAVVARRAVVDALSEATR